MCLGYLHGINLYIGPVYQCEVTLNTICSEMKSTPRVQLCCLLAAYIEHVIFDQIYIELRCSDCTCFVTCLFKYKYGSDCVN